MEIDDKRKSTKGSEFIRKLKSIKNIKIIAVIFIIAIALIIYSTVMTAKSGRTQTASNSAMTSDEARLSAILSKIEGAGEVETMITSKDGQIVGVLIIADGADSITVRLRLIDATATALGVDKRLVNVYLSAANS